jgi:kynurenine--oxoglutarate transaminase/cysteine-S-conjugate beta-lyase/glutamine--phenylpyruvate transaminase
VDLNSEKNEYKDVRFVKWMTKHVGLQGIPSSVFCSKSNKILGERFVRYCFCKKNETLLKAGQLLNQWRTREN